MQNAWSPVYAGGEWPRLSWLRALQRSRSGRRLVVLLDDLSICFNTTPLVGPTPDSVLPPNESYILGLLSAEQPEAVVACGKQAELTLLKLWGGPLLVVPHPAHRTLTDELYKIGRTILETGLTGRVALRQLIGEVRRDTL